MIRTALVTLALAAGPDFKKVDEVDGIVVETRPVDGSALVELRLTAETTKTAGSLCDAAFGDGAFDPEEPDLKARTIVTQGPDERVTYEQINPPLVANRDYAVRARRLRADDGSCRMTFEAANELAPAKPEGWVRITKLRGEWRFEPTAAGKTRVTYVIFSDPGGSLPAFLVEGSRRKIAVRWVKLIVGRGKAP